MTRITLLVALPLLLLVAAATQTKDPDHEAIKQTALDYGESWYAGDAERMERALHPDLAKRILRPDPRSGKGRIEHMSAMTLVQTTRKGSGTKVPADKRRTDVTILDVYGNAACVKLEMHDWIDYIQMSKMGGRWVIVNVLWEITPEAKKRWGIPAEL
ncbi:MAG: nuclear transport factor 2 family protein [Planctomycetes bacterium]|nr:nuclear transport factor 2 family protein [Planctomycetota bacterium]